MDSKQSFLAGLSKKRYLEVIHSLPTLQKERVKEYGTLILTFLSLSFFSIFAINPTLTTITDLKKQLSDNQTADAALKEKIKNLSTLQQSYTTLSPDLPFVDAAIPQTPLAIDLLGKIKSLAEKAHVDVLTMQVDDISLYTPKKGTTSTVRITKAPSYSFLVRVQGSNDELLSFLSSFISFDRIVTIESLSLSTNLKETNKEPSLTVHAYAYYMP